MSNKEHIQQVLRATAFDLSCNQVFNGYTDEFRNSIATWVASTSGEIPLQEGMSVQPVFVQVPPDELRQVIHLGTHAVYSHLVQGVSAVLEEANLREISAAELEEIIDEL